MKKTLTVLASLTVALGACSSSDGDDASSNTDLSSADASDTADGDEEATDSDNGEEGSDNEFCQKFMELDRPENEPTNQKELTEAFDDLIDSAPDEIRDDLETVRDAFSELEDIDEDDPSAEAAEEFLDVLAQPEVVEAGENLEAYTVDVCGIESEPTVTAADVEIPELSLPDATDE